MSDLSLSDTGELHLTIRGASEKRILVAVRRWPHWQRFHLEPDPANVAAYLSVTLTTDRSYEPMVREILKRAFGMTFPPEGGSCELAPEPPARVRRRSS